MIPGLVFKLAANWILPAACGLSDGEKVGGRAGFQKFAEGLVGPFPTLLDGAE